MKHTFKDAENLLFFLKKTVADDAKLIGSFGRGVESDHDIDVLIPDCRRTVRFVSNISSLLEAKSYEYTDWGGVFFHDTFFGDVDIFFTTKNFNK